MEYKESLINKVEKNFRTTFVGIVEAFEVQFQELLDDGTFKKKFMAARNKAFDIGNKQMRRSRSILERSKIDKIEDRQDFRVIDGGNSLMEILQRIGENDDRE